MDNNKQIRLFIHGLSGSGKDTVSNYLRDNYDFIKLRIAKTIKSIIFEMRGYKNQKTFEISKRKHSSVRTEHNVWGLILDHFGKDFSGSTATENRLKSIINGESLDYEMVRDAFARHHVICDVRSEYEINQLLGAGYTGIFLLRTTNEFKDASHHTEQKLNIIKYAEQYPDNTIIIPNTMEWPEKDLIKYVMDILDMKFPQLKKQLITL